jgi:cytochrome c
MRRFAAARLLLCAASLWTAAGVARASELDDRLAGANLKRGQLMFILCRTCHDLEPDLPHKAGPNLHGIIGRKAGSIAGFKFSDAMVKSSVVWTPETMDAWIKQPTALVPGSAMALAGLPSDADRASIIAWMLANGAQPAP